MNVLTSNFLWQNSYNDNHFKKGWRNARSHHHVVQCSLEEYTMIWRPYGTVLTDGTHNELTAMWYSVVRRNTRWRCIESDSSILIKDVCFIRVQLCLFISTRAPLCIAVATYQSFAVLICFSLWSKHGGLYSRLILIKYWWCRWDWLMLLGWIGSLLLIGLNTVCPDWSQHPVLIGLNTACPTTV